MPRTIHAPPPRDEVDAKPAGPSTATARFEVGFASEREERRVLAWLNAGLRPHRPGRLQREYAFLFGRNSAAVPITAYIDHRPVAFCMLWPAPFQLGEGTLRMGLISLVYTDPAHRGHGYASQTLHKAMYEARVRSLGCIALWSDLDDLYTSLGFLPSGCETLLSLDSDLIDRASAPQDASGDLSALEVSRPRHSDWLAIERIRSERVCTRPLPLEPTAIEAIPDMHVRVARRGERLVAFAIRGRGDDFPGVIHEWGGETSGALLCCRELTLPEPLVGCVQLLSSKARTDVTWRLRAAGAPVRQRALAWFQLADLTTFSADLAVCLGLKNAWSLSELKQEPSAVRSISVRSAGSELTISLQHFLDACFGASSAPAQSAALEAIAPLLAEEEGLALPLPFFISGLESI